MHKEKTKEFDIWWYDIDADQEEDQFGEIKVSANDVQEAVNIAAKVIPQNARIGNVYMRVYFPEYLTWTDPRK